MQRSNLKGLLMTTDKMANDLLLASGMASRATEAAQGSANIEAQNAIAILQKSVLCALAGGKLKGLPNLGTGSDSYRGINVRAKNKSKRLYYGEPALVIDRAGELTMVDYGREEIGYYPVDPATLTADDLQPVIDSYTMAINLHLDAANRAGIHYRSVEALAHAMVRAMEEHARL